MSIVGMRVRHIEYEWTGRVAVGGHTEDEIMVIWDEDGGASSWPPEALEWIEVNPTRGQMAAFLPR